MRSYRFLFAAIAATAAISCGEGSQPAGPLPDGNEAGVTLSAVSPLTFTVGAGGGVLDGPRVIARDSQGRPRRGVKVKFAILNGAGRVTNGFDTTGTDGVASASSWFPSTVAGQLNQLRAWLDNGQSVDFTAHVIAGPPAFLTKIDGDNQVAAAGSVTQREPRVRLMDFFSNLIVGATVDFEVTGGSGSIQRTSAVTDENGVSSPGAWRLGTEGRQVLTASVGNLTANFQAIALTVSAACDPVVQLQPQSVINGDINAQGCLTADNRHLAYYFLTLPQNAQVMLTAGTYGFDGNIEIRTEIGLVIASRELHAGAVATKLPASLPAGTYTIAVISRDAEAAGTYTISFGALSDNENTCDGLYVVQGAAFSVAGIGARCRTSVPPADVYRIHLVAGSELVVHLTDRSYSDWVIELQSLDGQLLARSSMQSYYNYELRHNVPSDADYIVKVVNVFDDGELYDIEFR